MDISSPPYPKNNTSPQLLYRYLTELYDWAAEQRDWANAEAERLGAPESPFVPPLGRRPASDQLERFLNLAVPDMYASWQALRFIRERHDEVVRNYELQEEWDSNPAIYHRINLVKGALVILDNAFLAYEQREARTATAIDQKKKEIMELLKTVFKDGKIKFLDTEEVEKLGLDNLFDEDDE